MFTNYNTSVWPSQLALYFAALVAVYLLFRPTKYSDKVISAILAGYWLWMGIMYHWLFFSSINPGARLFGALFVLQGLLLLYSGVIRKTLSFRLHRGWISVLGICFIVFGTIVYPVLGYLLGHIYPQSPTFGLPCPTTIFTFGVLLLSTQLPKHLIVIPFLWSIIGFMAALSFGIKEDVFLLIAGITSLVIILFKTTFFPSVGRENKATK